MQQLERLICCGQLATHEQERQTISYKIQVLQAKLPGCRSYRLYQQLMNECKPAAEMT